MELVAVAEAMAPTCSKRARPHIDDVLLSNKEVPGARRSYRMSQSLLLDYDTEWDALVNDNRLVNMSFFDELYKCSVICYKCDHLLKFEEVGYGPAKTVVAKCSNYFCDYDNKSIFQIDTLHFFIK